MVQHKKHETLSNNSPIYIYIKWINNRLVFTIKSGYKLDLQMAETKKLFGSKKKFIDKTKMGKLCRVLM